MAIVYCEKHFVWPPPTMSASFLSRMAQHLSDPFKQISSPYEYPSFHCKWTFQGHYVLAQLYSWGSRLSSSIGSNPTAQSSSYWMVSIFPRLWCHHLGHCPTWTLCQQWPCYQVHFRQDMVNKPHLFNLQTLPSSVARLLQPDWWHWHCLPPNQRTDLPLFTNLIPLH